MTTKAGDSGVEYVDVPTKAQQLGGLLDGPAPARLESRWPGWDS